MVKVLVIAIVLMDVCLWTPSHKQQYVNGGMVLNAVYVGGYM
jgi:hypothetical protein